MLILVSKFKQTKNNKTPHLVMIQLWMNDWNFSICALTINQLEIVYGMSIMDKS